MGRRSYDCGGDVEDEACLEELVAIPLIFDGIIQALGGTFLILGYTVTKEYVVRDDVGYFVTPMRVGSGYGVGAVGRF
jgi:hypothetical protein